MRWLLAFGGGAVLGIAAYQVQVDDLHSSQWRAAAQVAVGWTFIAVGVIATARRPANRLGLILLAAGALWLTRQLRYADDGFLFTAFFLIGDLCYAAVGHAVLAYPSGHVRAKFDRALMCAGYAVALALPLAILLVYDGASRLPQMQPGGRHDLISVVGSARTVDALRNAQVIVFFGVLGTLLLGVIAHRLVTAPPRSRRVLAPLLVAAFAIALRAVFECVFAFVDRTSLDNYLFWWQFAAVIALPIALGVGLLRASLARGAVGELVVELTDTPASDLTAALARAVGDPSLELALPLADGGFVDPDGRALNLPIGDPRRAVTRIEHGGAVVAALIHDPSLAEEQPLVQGVGAATALAIENARLQAELRAQLILVEESRARIVAARDEQRRRIERDLHDGAQQRLVAMALELRTVERGLNGELDPALRDLLAKTVGGLQAAVQELRELAHGIHPAILDEGGLTAALDALAARSPIPVTMSAVTDRFAPEVEADAYFIASEALANVAKHAAATRTAVTLSHTADRLVVEVTDDGSGGASIEHGTGLRGLADRVEARGGRLTIESTPGNGTRIVGEIPCAS